jgi:signal transduction histidine kinase
MFRSATFKLTMWYLAIVMAISLCFSMVLYNVATSELDRGLRNETKRFYSKYPSIIEGTPTLKPGEDYDDGAHRIFLRLALFNLVVLVGAGFSGYWLARRTLKPIEEAHEQQKRFTADVSHELRTPLTALRMESEVALMNKKASGKDLRKTIDSNLEEVTKLEALVNNLLRLAHLETDELRQNFTAVDGRGAIKDALKQIRPSAAAKHIDVRSKLEDLPLEGDRGSLIQLMVILLDNAVKYSPKKSVIEVEARSADKKAVITVSDHGRGIDPIALEHVFDRFYRADKSRAKDGMPDEGYGLGLSIAKMIADLHGGHIRLESRVGEGTTATVTLPLGQADDE